MDDLPVRYNVKILVERVSFFRRHWIKFQHVSKAVFDPGLKRAIMNAKDNMEYQAKAWGEDGLLIPGENKGLYVSPGEIRYIKYSRAGEGKSKWQSLKNGFNKFINLYESRFIH